MADIKIASMVEATSITDTDLIVVEDSADTKKITKANFKETMGINDKALNSDLTTHIANNAIDAHATTQFAQVAHTSSTTLPNMTWTTLPFNTEYSDTNSIHDSVTNNSRLTCQKAGVYLIVGAVTVAGITSGFASLRILFNGITPMVSSSLNGVTGGATDIQYINLVILSIGDYIELQAYQNRGSATSTVAALPGTPKFSMIKIG